MKHKENTELNEMETPNKIRLKVLTDVVKNRDGKYPKEYSKLMDRYSFDDHRRMLKIGNKVIGFIVSPYQLHPERHKALEMEGHTVIELRQYYHQNAETIAVIKNEYITQAIVWKVFSIMNNKERWIKILDRHLGNLNYVKKAIIKDLGLD